MALLLEVDVRLAMHADARHDAGSGCGVGARCGDWHRHDAEEAIPSVTVRVNPQLSLYLRRDEEDISSRIKEDD